MLRADVLGVQNWQIAALFNAIIFVRGCEDRDLTLVPGRRYELLRALERQSNSSVDLVLALSDALASMGVSSPLARFVDLESLSPFSSIDASTALNLFKDFYNSKESPYDFNFSLMSKHALSRIYERYVALFRSSDEENAESRQYGFLGPIPQEADGSKVGAIYTPQFVAGFFARFIRDNVTPRKFREQRVIDPACGSGIFLRTMMELQIDPISNSSSIRSVPEIFENYMGIDRDLNACEASRLSLTLLHLVSAGDLPESSTVNVRHGDAILMAIGGTLRAESFDAILSNPPYIKLDHLSAEDRSNYQQFLGEERHGRLDAYIAFVKLCLDLASYGGFVCLVLPQTFLTSNNAQNLRARMSHEFDVRCLVDLSAVSVFDGVGAYSVLLILQRRSDPRDSFAPPAVIGQVSELVGPALQACLESRSVDTPHYSVFEVPQGFFESKQWVLMSPDHVKIDLHLRRQARLSDFAHVRQGFVSGADNVFIIPRSEVPKREQAVYLDYLPDRNIGRFRVPKNFDQVVFYPFVDGRPLDEKELQQDFPQTWRYLESHRAALSQRRSVRANTVKWWRPERPREPEFILRPKIVAPHLMLTPRFALDLQGTVAVSHAPFVVLREPAEEDVLLRVFCAILNSSIMGWHIRAYAPKYSRGYSRIEVGLLNDVPIPDVGATSPSLINEVVRVVDKLIRNGSNHDLEGALDSIVAEMFGFSASDRNKILGSSR